MELIKKLKSNKKRTLIVAGIILLTFLLPYFTVPALLIWWFYKKSKLSKKFKVVSTSIVVGLFVLLASIVLTAYYNDVEPSLIVTEPSKDVTVQSDSLIIKGKYSPEDRNVWINDVKIEASNGQFETKYYLTEGKNEIEIKSGNWKRTYKTLIVTRELTAAEKDTKEKITREKPKATATPIAKPQKSNHTPTKKSDKDKIFEENNKQALDGAIIEVFECKKDFNELMVKELSSTVTINNTIIPSGTLLTQAWSEYLRKESNVKEAGYFYYPDKDGGCILGFSVVLDNGLKNIYSYKKENNKFIAKNAPANRLTPDLVKQQLKEDLGLTPKEQEIYKYGIKLNDKYMSQYSVEIAEQKALSDTAKKYGMNESDVIKIIDKATWNMIKNR